MTHFSILRRAAVKSVVALAPIWEPALDFANLAAFTPKNPRPHTKHRQLRAVQRRCNARTLVETGTFYGTTAAQMAPHFDLIHTIELSADLARHARKRLARFPNVHCIQGDAVEALPNVFADGRVQRALVYLDAHFSGGATVCGDVPEPAVLELACLEKHQAQIAAIVIDDFRCFGVEPGFPTKFQVIGAAERFQAFGFKVQVHLDQILIERQAS